MAVASVEPPIISVCPSHILRFSNVLACANTLILLVKTG